MATVNKNLPVDVLVVEPTAIEGEHIGVGTKINKMEAGLAMELAGAGKVRLWTKELEEELKERVRSEKAAQKKREDQGNATATLVAPPQGVSPDALAAAVQAGIAQGIEAGLKLIAEASAPIEDPPAEDPPAGGDQTGNNNKP